MSVYNVNGNEIQVDAARQHSYPSLSMFESIGIIGDSFASGSIYVGGVGVSYYDLSWGQVMARSSGCMVVNYSKSGLTTKTWLTDETYGLAKLNSENANQLYIIALGINDANVPIPLGMISDITSDSTDSFYSYYGRIIRAIQDHAPNSIIMLSTIARFFANYNTYSDAIKAIGTYYSLPVFDLSKDEFFQSEFFADNHVNSHPTAVNYSAMAREYKRLIEKELEDNADDYKTYVGINGEVLNTSVNRFRVCAFNVGNFSLGASGNPDGTDDMYNDFLVTFRQCMANVYMFSEWDVNFKVSETSASVFSFLKPYHTNYIKTGTDEYAGQMTYSDYAITSEYYEDFINSGPGGYYFVDNVIKINGYDIHFICTHLTWKTEAWRDAQINQILDYISSHNITYYVIGGDMNLGLHGQDGVPDTTELKFEIARRDVNLLESNGAVSLQGGTWGLRDKDGFFNTAGSLGWDAPNTNMFDNMVVSPNIRINNVFVVVSDASDHNALCADFEISG